MSEKKVRKHNVLLILLLSFIVLTIALYCLLESKRNHLQEKHLQLLTDRYAFAYSTIYDQYKQLATAIQSGIVERYNIPSLYRQLLTADGEEKDRLRRELAASIKSRYKGLQHDMSAKQLIHFHLRNNESFLRLHQLDKYGDNLADIRKTVEMVNKTHVAIDGFEEGKIFSGYRFVFPITGADKTHLGSIEVSFGPETMTSAMMKQYVVLSNFFIKEGALREQLLPGEFNKNYKKSHHRGYLFDRNVLATLKDITHKEIKEFTPQKKTTDAVFINAHSDQPMSSYDSSLDMVFTTIPVLSPVTGKMVAFCTVRSHSDFFGNLLQQFRSTFLLSLLLLLAIFSTFYLQYSKKKLLEVKNMQLDKQRLQLVEAQSIAKFGHWELDHITRRIRWSEQVYSIFELQPEVFAGTFAALLERVHPADRDLIITSYLDTVKDRSPCDIHHRIITSNGVEKWVRQIFRTSYDKAGTPVSTLGIIHDVTERIEVEESLSLARQKAEVANQTKSAFLSNMSHELRTPLNAILGYTQLFADDVSLTTQQQSGIKTMHQAGKHLLLLLNDILDLSKIEAGKTELLISEFRLPDFLQGVVAIIRLRVGLKELDFSYDLEGEIPLVIQTDQLRLRQVLLNLLSNAIKFTKSGSCSLRIRSQEIPEDRVRLTFLVEDSGPGIAPEMQEEVFLPFQQLGDRLQHSEGSGLGLAISRKLVRLMGGELQLLSPINEQPKSGEGAGCCFFFTLEVPVSGHELTAAKEERKVTGYTASAEGRKRILIVDDKQSNRSLLRDILEPLGFMIVEATEGNEVLASCKEFKPDMVLMDIRMPGMNGFAATKQLQQHPDYTQIPVIAVTASSIASDLRQPFAGVVAKPFSAIALLETMAAVLSVTLTYTEELAMDVPDSEIPRPPAEDLEELLLLVSNGDIAGISQKVAALAVLDSGRYRAFAAKVLELADNFQLRKIRQFINSQREKA